MLNSCAWLVASLVSAGLGLGIVLLLYQDVLRATVLRRLTKVQAYRLLTLLLVLIFLIAILALLA